MENGGFAKNKVIEDLSFDYTPINRQRKDDTFNQPTYW